MADGNKNIFARLTKLFRSGPVIRRKVKGASSAMGNAATSLEVFRKSRSDVYNSTLSSYGAFDRMSRYSDFAEMEATPEIASALDIYAEETVSPDSKGNILHIYSDNRKIQEILESLFYDTINVEFNLPMWVRNLVKYGDFFLFNDVSPEYGIINTIPVPISEIEREEGYDPDDPMAVRFRWITQGNQILENWQITHFRLLGNDAFLPYGNSVLESARRIWRQLILIEDAMLVYRVIRAPERRVFYIDVGNVPPDEVANYLEQAQTSLKRNQIVDKETGKVDLRYNPLSVDEDYILPVRGGESGTRIETLAGGTNTAAIEDVEYIQKKLFSALKIPKAYLGYDEALGSKATLAQEDIRFSRSIQRIQKVVLSELNKLAMIHLYAHGYEDDDLLDFTLKLSNPSSIAQQQKLELIRTKFEIAGSAPEGVVSRNWVRKNIINLTEQEIDDIIEDRVSDKREDAAVENALEPEGEGEGEGAGGGEEFGGGEEVGGGGLSDLFSADKPEGVLLTSEPPTEDEEEDEDEPVFSIDDDDAPVKLQNKIKNVFNEPIEKSRKVTAGAASTHMPDFATMTNIGKAGRTQDSLNKPFDSEFFKNPFGESYEPAGGYYEKFLNDKLEQQSRMTKQVERAINSMSQALGIKGTAILNEIAGLDEEDMYDVDLVDDEEEPTDG